MLILTEVTDKIQVVLGGAITTNQMQCKTSWRDITTTVYTPGRTVINTNNTTDVDIVGSPGASTQRVVDLINIYNNDTVSQTLTVKFDANGTEYILWKGVLTSGDLLFYQDGMGWNVYAKKYGSILYNASVAQQGAGFATDTYLIGSSIPIPDSSLKIGSRFYCVFNVTKTGAGTVTPIINIRFGVNGSTADTTRGTLTWTAQTAAADEGVYEIWATFRAVGSGTSAVLQTLGRLTHRLVATGFGNTAVSEPEIATSGGFDSTVSNSIIGLSVNGGTSASWTVQLVQAQLENLI